MSKSVLTLAALITTAITGSANAAVLFGLNDTGGIFAVNPQTGAANLYRATVANPNGQLNALSYDTNADTFYYITQGNRQLHRAGPVSTTVVATLPSGSYANSAFHNGNVWAVRDGSGKLVRIDLTGLTPVVSELTVTGIGSPSFGDIAINSAGMLFGAAAGRFFSIDLAAITPSATSVAATSITTNMVNLQLGFIGGTLFGFETDTDKIFSISTGTGVRTQVQTLGTTSLKINDAASVIPEPAAGLSLVAAGLLAGRRTRRA